MLRRVTLRSLAKINLDLRVLNRRRDGFHELRSVFQTISLADTISIEYRPARKTEIALDGAGEILDNLIVRTARAVLEGMGEHAAVRFTLTKRIPIGAGLGGGSSDAAAVLLALPVLAGRALPMEALVRMGAVLGSDVPFFLTGGTALALDRGIELYGLPEIAEEPVLVVSPGFPVDTPRAYRALRRGLTFVGLSRSIVSFQSFARTLEESRSAETASALRVNDFEAVVFRQHPTLKTMQAGLREAGAAGAGMTGSGSSLFAIFGSIPDRERARELLNRDRVMRGCRVIPARLVNRRSYRRLWQRQLAEHLAPEDETWPPRSRYAR